MGCRFPRSSEQEGAPLLWGKEHRVMGRFAWSVGGWKELTAFVKSSVCSLEPRCSLHLIFQKHQQIRKEACPEIAIWMNVTFVGQRRKLGELMGFRPTAQLASCILQPEFPNNVHVWRRNGSGGGGERNTAGWAALHKVGREPERKEALLVDTAHLAL